jgi:5-methylcytosine-specific restriction endonuclease McrA
LERSDSALNVETSQNAPSCAKEKKAKRSIPLKLRYDVLKRDGFRCVLCGRSPATVRTVKLHVDHLEPEAKGGPTVIENLRTLCEECNVGRGIEE